VCGVANRLPRFTLQWAVIHTAICDAAQDESMVHSSLNFVLSQ